MIRGFFRLIGLLLLAGAFIFVVYDGARWVADQTLRLTRLGELWNDINQASQQSAAAAVNASAPWLSGAFRLLLEQPVFAVLGIVGLVLMVLFRSRKPLIGYTRN